MTDKSQNALDVIWGARAIAAELNCSERKVFHLLETGRLPAEKTGKIWATTRSRLKRHFDPETTA